jgi:hypothetical protein
MEWFNAAESDYKLSRRIVLLENTYENSLQNCLSMVAKKFIHEKKIPPSFVKM